MNADQAREKFDRRSEETRTIKRIGDDGTVHTDLWSYGGRLAADLLAAGVQPGDQIVVETVLGSQVTGLRRVDQAEWIVRQSTDELITEHLEMVAGMRRREQEQLDANRENWLRREAALPLWLRDRLATFHERGGEDFARRGWGYELVICEITVILLAQGLDEDAAEVMAYARQNGTSGNQHGMALALARAHLEDPTASMGGTVSALSPITGNPDYSTEGDAA